ncbi:hypothetical protein P7C70_g4614, partial [Phenoliferia sp. Uapishka_3]
MDSPLLAAPDWFVEAATPICAAIGLPTFAPVVHLAFVSCFLSFSIQYISSFISPKLFPKYYPTLKAKRDDWDLHVVGWAYSLVATPLALALILNPSKELLVDPLYGWAVREARLSAIATGYFVWDTKVSAQHIGTQGLGFLAHGLGCGAAFAFTLRPFLLYCGPDFLIWELSTIFLNVHWFCDKFQMTGSTLQLINGGFLILAYVGARLIWGTYNSVMLIKLLFGAGSNPDVGFLRYFYVVVNVGLNSLNLFWFRAMVLALKKRFVKADPNAKNEVIAIDGKLNWKGKKTE